MLKLGSPRWWLYVGICWHPFKRCINFYQLLDWFHLCNDIPSYQYISLFCMTNSSRSMLRFDQLESVNVEVWPTRVGQCWGLTNSNSFINIYIYIYIYRPVIWGRTGATTENLWKKHRPGICIQRALKFIQQNISVGHFWWSNSVRIWPTQSGTTPPPLLWSIPGWRPKSPPPPPPPFLWLLKRHLF